MEVCDYVVSIMYHSVNRRVSKNYPSQAPHCKEENEAHGPYYGGLVLDSGAMDCGQSAEHFNSCGDSNYHGSSREVSTRVTVHSNCKHVVSSDEKTEDSNGKHSIDHAQVPESLFFSGVVRDDMRDDAEARKDQNINFWVTEESE